MRDPSSLAAGARRLSLLLLTLLLSGCTEVFPPSHPFSALEVEVNSRNGEGAQGVTLLLYDWKGEIDHGMTDARGRHVFEFVPEGEFGVQMIWIPEGYALPPGARDHVHALRLEDRNRLLVDFTLLKEGPGSISVTARTEEGEPVAGAVVEVRDTAGVVADGVTDASGALRFEEVPFGSYSVHAGETPGWTAVTASVEGLVVDEGAEESAELIFTSCAGPLQVNVVDVDGAPVAEVLLALSAEGVEEPTATATTDDTGAAHFTLACGVDYSVRPTSEEYLATPESYESLRVGEEEALEVSFVVEEVIPTPPEPPAPTDP